VIFDGETSNGVINAAKNSFFNGVEYQLIQRPRQGLVKTLNYGLDMCKTHYFARLDCDDIMHPQRLERQLSALLSDTNVGVAGSRIQLINDRNMLLSRKKQYYPVADLTLRIYGALYNNPIAHPSSMSVTATVKRVGGYSSAVPVEDYHLWAKVALRAKIINLPDQLLFYRIHQDQLTASQAASYLASLKIRLLFAYGIIRRYAWAAPILIMLIPLSLLPVASLYKFLKRKIVWK
jgi:glycosyltransferase involved in cell wall biosynthesis